ncbi:MAG: sensor histidine kinase, partial [Solirubrobacteraceae bacterium]
DLPGGRRAAVDLPSGMPADALERLRDRVAPSLAALLAAALDRDRLQAEVVETQALRRSDVIKTTLLRAVSHDLRTPLTAIMAAGDAVRSPALGAAEREELGAVVVEEAERLSRLIDKLLDLSRLQAGEAQARRDWCSIEEAVEAALEHADAAVPVEVKLDRELPLVQADAAQLERVFANLIENAQRHSGGHPVKLRARVTGGRLMIRVIDRGPGIPAELLPHVFEPFRRGESDGAHPGSGLGLAIVRGFVEANGGRVWAESLPDQGTVFVVELPLADRPVART